MKYCRIDLSKTNYHKLPIAYHIEMIGRDSCMDQLKEIYRKYPNDCVIVDQDAGLTMYVIRNS